LLFAVKLVNILRSFATAVNSGRCVSEHADHHHYQILM